MSDGLSFFIAYRFTSFYVPQRSFTVQKITFAWGETASVKNASVTGNAVSTIGRNPLASGKVLNDGFGKDMRKFGIDFHHRSVGDGAIAINVNNITAGNGFVLIAVLGHFISTQGVIGLFQFNIASCKKAAVSLIHNNIIGFKPNRLVSSKCKIGWC